MSVDYVLEDDLAIVTLNRPDRYNAIDASVGEGLIRAANRAGEEARALVLTGSGKAFCSGADLNDLMADYESGDGPDLSRLLEDVFHPALQALLDCEVPVIGAINGVAAGAGLGLALACDIRVMADEAFLTSAFTAIGLVPDSGTTWWLSHHLGVSRALEIAFTNRRSGRMRPVSWGFASMSCPVISCSIEHVRWRGSWRTSSPILSSPQGVSSERPPASPSRKPCGRSRQSRVVWAETPEHREGVMAFIEKRKPDFRA